MRTAEEVRYLDDLGRRYHKKLEEEERVKLDAKFYGQIYKAKDGSLVPEDEYVVFLAKDNAFADVLPVYLEVCARRGCDAEHLAAVRKMIDRLRAWRRANLEKLKDPDAKGEHLLY